MLRWIFVLMFWFVSGRTRLYLKPTDNSELKRFHFTENKMGSPFNLIFYHTDSLEAVAIAKECFLLVDSLNTIFSDYSPASEVGRLAQQPAGTYKVSDELLSMIVQSKQAWESSAHSFDISIGSLTQLWRTMRKENKFPDDTEIKDARRSIGFENVLID